MVWEKVWEIKTKLLKKDIKSTFSVTFPWCLRFRNALHCATSVRIWSFSSPYFPEFGLNTKRYAVSLRIQSKCGKIRTRKTSNTHSYLSQRLRVHCLLIHYYQEEQKIKQELILWKTMVQLFWWNFPFVLGTKQYNIGTKSTMWPIL